MQISPVPSKMGDLTYGVLNVLKEQEKKNKRGEYGSTEEDTRAGKKANVAGSGTNTVIEEAI